MAENFGSLINLGMSTQDINDAVNSLLSGTPSGSLSWGDALRDTLYGVNQQLITPALPINRDTNGLTFFVRPMINLSSDNLRLFRMLSPLSTRNQNSIARVIRAYLDPMQVSLGLGEGSVLVDNNQAFIPLLSNTLVSMSGWPDNEVPTYTTPAGLYRETWTIADGMAREFGPFDITCNFRNIKGDPITYLFLIWVHYMSAVFEGLIWPYSKFVIDNSIDYTSRIYRFTMDETQRRITKVACSGVSIPTAVPIGSAFDFDEESHINGNTHQLSVRFACTGAIYMDEIIFKYFNNTVVFFNTDMHDLYREAKMVLVDYELLPIFKNRGYPRVNTDTYEMEWWVYREMYNSVMSLGELPATLEDLS